MTTGVQDIPPNDRPTPELEVAGATNPPETAVLTSSLQDIAPPNGQPAPEQEPVDTLDPPENAAITKSLQDTSSANDQPTQEHDAVDTSDQQKATSLGPAYAILRALHADRIPEGTLGAETVPAAALDLPIAVAIEDLIHHAKRCQSSHCTYVPQPLRPYRYMRPAAIRNAKQQVYKVLWSHPNNELVVQVRKQILEKHAKLADEISTGKLLAGQRLEEVLNEQGPDGPRVLRAVLWASEFRGPGADLLFRSLVPLTDFENSQSAETDEVVMDDDRRKLSLKAKRKSVRDFARQKQAAEQVTKELHLKELALSKAKGELEDVQRKYYELAKQLAAVERELKDSNDANRTLEHNGDKAARANANLRRDLRQMQDAQRELDLGRSDLARQLAAGKREVENLKLRLDSVPRGSDAVIQFLRTEEDRIQTDRTISSGGTKERAEQEWLLHRKFEKAFLEFRPQYRQPPPVRIRPKSSLRLLALGGSDEVGRSCYLLEIGKHRILVDCGIKPSACEDLHPNIERLERLDALILTHAHTDHIGWVPALTRKFPELDIYCSEGTAALLPVMLDDCYQHYVRKMWAQREHAKYIANAVIAEEKYDADDVHAVPNLLIKCTFNEEEQLPFGGASIRFYRAGHILGAASVLIQDQSGRRIFFSGDFSSFPQLTVQAADWPDDLGEVDLLILESTYGDRVHKPLDGRRSELISFVRKTINGPGSVILASFGLGRAQELLMLISSAQSSGELPAVPVYVDGMIKRINPIYQRLADPQLSFGNLYEVSGEADRQDVAASAQEKPSIIVTTSGMLTGGPVLYYSRLLLPDPRHRIVLTGYQDEGAPSRALRDLIDGPRRVRFPDERGDVIEFEAAMPAKEVSLSSHADQPGLIDYAGRLRPKHIVLVHGERTAQEVLRQRLLQTHCKSDVICGPSELSVP